MKNNIDFKCTNTVKIKRSGKEVKCGSFLASISDRILLVCRKCGGRFSLTQNDDGSWIITHLVKVPVLDFNRKGEKK